MLFRADSVAFPRQADALGGVPHAVDSWPGLAAGRLGGKGQAAGRGVQEDIAEQETVKATEHVHHAAR